MKKIITLVALAALMQTAAMAQQEKAVAEKEVKINYVNDFQKQVKNATDIAWYRVDSLTYKVRYTDEEQSRQAMVFSNRGTETHYYIDSRWYPQAIRDTVSRHYVGFSIDELWVRKARGKMTYQARIAQRSGFLWWKKVKAVKTLNFETADYKFINEEE